MYIGRNITLFQYTFLKSHQMNFLSVEVSSYCCNNISISVTIVVTQFSLIPIPSRSSPSLSLLPIHPRVFLDNAYDLSSIRNHRYPSLIFLKSLFKCLSIKGIDLSICHSKPKCFISIFEYRQNEIILESIFGGIVC